MKIAFVASYLRTETFYGISEYLDADVYWITTGDPDWVDFLLKKGVPNEKILNLSSAYFCDDTDISPILEMEEISPLKASAIIMSDRLLSQKSREKAYPYIASVYEQVKAFIKKHNINVVFGESTWTAELVASVAAKKCNIPYLTPATIRVPGGRFAFFEGFYQSKFFLNENPEKEELTKAEQVFDEFIKMKPVPDYALRRRNFSLFSVENFKKLKKHVLYRLKHKDRDMTRPDVDFLFNQKIYRRNNAKRLKRMGLSKDISFLADMKYCIYNLHLQPEASIDVLGAYNSDQFNIIQNISRSLPADAVVVVKEHPQGVGDRVREFYNAVQDLPNALLVHPESDPWELMRNAFAVLTISGTAAYQAALMGVPSVVFSDVYFDELPLVKRCRNHEELPEILSECAKIKHGGNREASIYFLAKVLKNSYEGSVYGREVSDENVQNANLKLAAEGFKSVMRRMNP